jgi:hypothetical protein
LYQTAAGIERKPNRRRQARKVYGFRIHEQVSAPGEFPVIETVLVKNVVNERQVIRRPLVLR